MSRDKILNLIGFGLLALCYVLALSRVATRSIEESNPDSTTIRFAHWQLESGLREAFNKIATRYEEIQAAQGNEVNVIQVAIPETVYASWVKTQILGGQAPEIIMATAFRGIDDTMMARFFLPLGEYIDAVNPYNEGTHLEGVAWRNSFPDGMERSGYHTGLLEHYSIPFTTLTVRVYYNRTILEEMVADPDHRELRTVLGDDLEPETYGEFLALCEAAAQWGLDQGRNFMPIAGSQFNATMLVENFYNSQTQRLRFEWDPFHGWDMRQSLFPAFYLRGERSIEHPAFRSAFGIAREVGVYMPTGFMQMRREDATFYFLQENALMICTGAWDAPSLLAQTGDKFAIGIFEVPLPARDHPEHGEHVLGSFSEADVVPYGALSVVNYHGERKRETAIDFLRFLSSVEGQTIFTNNSYWPPGIVGVEAPEVIRPFQPHLEGYPKGIVAHFHDINLRRALDTNFYRLFSRDGSVDEFLERAAPMYRDAMAERLVKVEVRDAEKSAVRDDTLLGSYWWLRQHGTRGDETDLEVKIERMLESQAAKEMGYYYSRNVATELGLEIR